jgi:ABC-type glutathione transport system ATPase component
MTLIPPDRRAPIRYPALWPWPVAYTTDSICAVLVSQSSGRRGLGASSSGEAIGRVDGLSKTYGRVHALEDVAFSICAGEILGLIGPNGTVVQPT